MLPLLLLVSSLGFSQMLPIPDSELISTSEDIVQGSVVSTKAMWVNHNKYIYTFTKVKVDQVFSGKCNVGDTVTVVTPGGYDPVKDVGMGVSSQASFEQGEKAILYLVAAKGEMDAIDYSFLKNEPAVPSNVKRVNGYYQGKHKIIHDKSSSKTFVFKSNENKMVDLKMSQLSLKQEIKQLKKTKVE